MEGWKASSSCLTDYFLKFRESKTSFTGPTSAQRKRKLAPSAARTRTQPGSPCCGDKGAKPQAATISILTLPGLPVAALEPRTPRS